MIISRNAAVSYTLFIPGNVQGVGFRQATAHMARKLEVTGWVKNTKEGKVEVQAEGEETQLLEFEEWCKKGPPPATVSDVKTIQRKNTPQREFESFEIVY